MFTEKVLNKKLKIMKSITRILEITIAILVASVLVVSAMTVAWILAIIFGK
jgi:hypothetical protein